MPVLRNDRLALPGMERDGGDAGVGGIARAESAFISEG